MIRWWVYTQASIETNLFVGQISRVLVSRGMLRLKGT